MLNQTIEGYKFEARLGKGTFGEVWRVSKGSKKYAIKIMGDDDSSTEVELNLAENIRFISPFLVKYFKSFSLEGFLYVVMEFCEQGDLSKLLKSLNKSKGIVLSIDRIMKIFLQMVIGLDELHTAKMVHRDLKPENAFVTDKDDVKIGDYGCMKILDSTTKKASTFAGTQSYMSPEIYNAQPYDSKSDIWSLGVVLYQMCVLDLPFKHPNPFMVPGVVMAGKYPAVPKYSVPDEVVNIIDSMLNLDPTKRPSTTELLNLPIMRSFAEKFDMLKYIHGSSSFSLSASTPAKKTESIPSADTTTTPTAPVSRPITKPQIKSSEGSDLPITFRTNPLGGYTVTHTADGELCTFTATHHTIFLTHVFSAKGVYRWTIRVNYQPGENSSSFCIGAAPPNLVSACDEKYIGYEVAGTCSLDSGRSKDGALKSYLWGVDNGKNCGIIIPDNSIVSIEVDTGAGTLAYFVNNVKIPFVVTKLPTPYQLGITSFGQPSFTSLSLQKLAAATPSPVQCMLCPFRPATATPPAAAAAAAATAGKQEVDLPMTFRANPLGGYTVTHTADGELCTFTATHRTVFLTHVFSAKGVYRWTIRIKYMNDGASSFCMGASPPNLLNDCNEKYLGYEVNGTVSLDSGKTSDGSLKSYLWGVEGGANNGITIPDKAVVAIEVDTGAGTLAFFVNDIKIPYVISKLPVPYHLGITSYGEPSFTSLSLKQLTAPTPSQVVCKFCDYTLKK